MLQNPRWLRCGLPRSVNTILDDIKLGLPEDRLADYAAFLDIPINLLEDPDVAAGSMAFIQTVFAAREQAEALSLPLCGSFSSGFCRQFYVHNTKDSIAALFTLLRGIHALHVIFPPDRTIHCGCALVHSAEDHLLRAQGFLCVQGVDVVIEAGIFRWGNNLHITYHSQDLFVFGRLIATDPLRDFALARRKPFSLTMSGVADALFGPLTYGILHGRAELIERPPGSTLWERWERTCRKIRRRPRTLPGDADYARLFHQILAQVPQPFGPVTPSAP